MPPSNQNDWENLVSRNSPNFAVALNCGMGSSSFERRRERVGKTPNGPRPELFILRFKAEIMDSAGKMFRSLQFALDERFINHNFRCDIREFAPLPGRRPKDVEIVFQGRPVRVRFGPAASPEDLHDA